MSEYTPFKSVEVTMWLSDEEYDAIPIQENSTSDETTKWKQFDNVTFFNPRTANAGRSVVYISLKDYNSDTFKVKVVQES